MNKKKLILSMFLIAMMSISLINVQAVDLAFNVKVGDKQVYTVDDYSISGILTKDQQSPFSDESLSLKKGDKINVEITSVSGDEVKATITNGDKSSTNQVISEFLVDKTTSDTAYWTDLAGTDTENNNFDSSSKTFSTSEFITMSEMGITFQFTKAMFIESGWFFKIIFKSEINFSSVYSKINFELNMAESQGAPGFELIPFVISFAVISLVIAKKKNK